ncbi:MAG TPA: ATP-binding protein [Candidatus Eisenbacteria bacterium]|nr:ATP-binding protein [Candidatus Eisenbacteria bacterium]
MQLLRVGERSQAGDARRAALQLARQVGLGESDTGRVGLVVTEAATNLVKYARDGEIVMSAERNGDGASLRVLAMDQGPGIGSLETSFRDGVSSTGTLGGGLGAIRRSASEFDIYTGSAGTVIYALVSSEPARPKAVLAGAVCAPRPGETACGDAFAIENGASVTTVLVVDGLGHGPGAEEAAQTAVACFRAHPGDSPTEGMTRLHGVLRATRGAAAAIARIDRGRRVVRFAGIGNISGVVLGETSRHMISDHGIVGHSARQPHELEYPLPPHASVVLHTDGIGSRWKLESYPGILRKHPMVSAGLLFRDHRRGNDDATIVFLREAA